MYTRITATHNGREALAYARGVENGKGHNNKEHRNLLVGSVNMIPDDQMSFEDQMEKYWYRASAQHKVQVRRIIGSFSKNELDPEDPNSKFKALQMAMLFAEQYYPNRQSAIFIQDDGVGGCIHFHLIVNDCDMISAKGCNLEQQKYWFVEKNFDALAKDFITLDTGKKSIKDKKAQYERSSDQKSKKGEKVGYVWKDDLKSRVREAMEVAKDRDDFLKELTLRGVEGEYRHTKGNGDFIIYELTDLSGFEGDLPKKREYFKSKSYKMGSDYGLEELDRLISEKQKPIFDFQSEPEIKGGSIYRTKPVEKSPEQIEKEKKEIEDYTKFVLRAREWIDEKYGFGDDEEDTKWMSLSSEQRTAYMDEFRAFEAEKKQKKEVPEAIIEPVKEEIPVSEPVKTHTEPVKSSLDPVFDDLEQQMLTLKAKEKKQTMNRLNDELIQKLIRDGEELRRKQIQTQKQGQDQFS